MANSSIDSTPLTPIRSRNRSHVAANFARRPLLSLPPRRALIPEELEEWRTFIHPLARTDAEIRRAQCDMQPTVNTVRYQLCTGLPRVTPQPPELPPGREANDYDALRDTRSYSPNNRIRGFPEYDRQEIERENDFPAPRSLTPPPTSPERPEEGDVEAVLWPSLTSDPDGPIEMPQRSWNGAYIAPGDAPGFARRFRLLPHRLQGALIWVVHRTRVDWMDALSEAEDALQRWFYLVPGQKRIFFKTRRMHREVTRLLKHLRRCCRAASVGFRNELANEWPLRGTTQMYQANITAVLGDLLESGDERAVHPDGTIFEGVAYWLVVIQLIDEQDLPVELRKIAVQKLLNIRRIENLVRLESCLAYWLQEIGERGVEIAGVYERGDFWRIHTRWEGELEDAKTRYCLIGWEEAGVIKRERLQGEWRGAGLEEGGESSGEAEEAEEEKLDGERSGNGSAEEEMSQGELRESVEENSDEEGNEGDGGVPDLID